MDQRLQGPTGGALAEPVVEEPTDEELLEINDGAYCPCADEVNGEDDSSWQYTSDYIRWLDENGTPQEQGAYAAKGLRAVFEAGRRWGHQPVPPVEGEVGELVAWLRETGDLIQPSHLAEHQRYKRAADLLEHLAGWKESALAVEREWDAHGIATMLGCKLGESQRACIQREVPRLLDQLRELEQRHPAPVPVAERLPGPEDCDAEGRCWWLAPETAQKCAVWCFGPKYPPSMFGATHWLPATALPLPQGEVE